MVTRTCSRRETFNRGLHEPELALGEYVPTGAGRAHCSQHPQSSEAERKQAGVYLAVLISTASLPVPLLQGLQQSWALSRASPIRRDCLKVSNKLCPPAAIPLLKVDVITGVCMVPEVF